MKPSEIIKQNRIRKGFSQEKLAEIMGVSRQAVTKWENGQSLPSSENLLKLSEVLEVSFDSVAKETTVAQQVFELYQKEEQRKKDVKIKNLKMFFVFVLMYIILYLLGRVFCTVQDDLSVMGWLFGTDPTQTTYLFGWLVKQKLFFMAMLISVLPALLGKYRFSAITFGGFSVGFIIGELFGNNPNPQPFEQDHYGWIIWILCFAVSIIIGIISEKLNNKKS